MEKVQLKTTVYRGAKMTMKKYSTLLTIFSLLANTVLADELKANNTCYSSPYDLIKEHSNILIPGEFSLMRSSTDKSVVSLLLKDNLSSKPLKEIGANAGTEIVEICGISVASIFKSNSKNPVCCNSKYPNYLTLKLKNSLIETYEVDLQVHF